VVFKITSLHKSDLHNVEGTATPGNRILNFLRSFYTISSFYTVYKVVQI
jgi:hypothetical protein